MLDENQINAQEMENQIDLNLDLADRLKKAIEERDLDLVDDLLAQGAEPNTISRDGLYGSGRSCSSGDRTHS